MCSKCFFFSKKVLGRPCHHITRDVSVLVSALKILHVGEDISSRGFFFFFSGFFGGGFPPFFFFFFWQARVEDYPPRGFIVGSHFVSPEGANIFPSLYAPSRAAP